MRYSADTKMPPEKVIDLAVKHFESSGGLKMTSRTNNSLCFEGTDGYVTISACKSDLKGKKTHMEFESREYDGLVTEFLRTF